MTDATPHVARPRARAPAFCGVGIAPGDFIDAIRDEVDQAIEVARGNRLKAIQNGFRRMAECGLVTQVDVRRLDKAALIVLAVDAGKKTPEQGAGALDELYLDSVADPLASTMGSTMIGVTYSSRSRQTAQASSLMGMVVGGLLTAGPWGALVGSLVGWSLGGRCARD